jgi:COP9 signalosome complex subunit 8
MTGPPTPPPTTAAEMADEARISAPVITEPSVAASPAAVTVQPKQGSSQDTYQLLFPTLGNLAYQGDYRQIIDVAERGDLKV